jgi:hypothetical protein
MQSLARGLKWELNAQQAILIVRYLYFYGGLN